MNAPISMPGETQAPIPEIATDVPGPVSGNTMPNAYVQLVGRMAYVLGYPMVNAHNRRAAFAGAPAPGLLGGADLECLGNLLDIGRRTVSNLWLSDASLGTGRL